MRTMFLTIAFLLLACNEVATGTTMSSSKLDSHLKRVSNADLSRVIKPRVPGEMRMVRSMVPLVWLHLPNQSARVSLSPG